MKNVVAIVAAVMLGLVAVLAVSSYVSGIQEAAAKQLVTAVAAARDIAKGDQITIEDLEQKEVKKDDNVIAWEDRAMVVAGQTASIPIKSGDVIKRTMFSEAERRFAKDLLKPNQRAVTLPVDNDSGFAGMLVPGDVIDILITYVPTGQMLASLGAAGTKPPGGAEGGSEAPTGGMVTTWMMQNVTIIALDNRTTMGVYNAEGSDYNAKQYSTITIAVPPDEAQLIIFSRQSAGVKMTFLLRNPDDHAPVSNATEMNYSWFSHLLEQSSGGGH